MCLCCLWRMTTPRSGQHLSRWRWLDGGDWRDRQGLDHNSKKSDYTAELTGWLQCVIKVNLLIVLQRTVMHWKLRQITQRTLRRDSEIVWQRKKLNSFLRLPAMCRWILGLWCHWKQIWFQLLLLSEKRPTLRCSSWQLCWDHVHINTLWSTLQTENLGYFSDVAVVCCIFTSATVQENEKFPPFQGNYVLWPTFMT